MSSTSTYDLSNSFLGLLEAERLAFWRHHAHWSEARRRKAWSQQTANLATHLGGDSARPGHVDDPNSALPASGKRERLALDTSVTRKRTAHRSNEPPSVAMSRTDSGSHSSTTPSTRPTDFHANWASQRLESAAHSAPCNGASTFWTGTGNLTHHHSQPVTVYKPADYVSKLECSSDTTSHIAAKRRRVEGSSDANHPPFPRVSYPCTDVSPCSTSSSCNLSPPPSLIASDDTMSRQSSMTSAASSFDGADMLRVESSFSTCSDNMLFPFDGIDASFLSCVAPKPSNSFAGTGFADDAAASQLLSGMGCGFVGPQELSFSSSIVMNDGQWLEQGQDSFSYSEQDMRRSSSDQSITTSSDIKANERRRKHLENGQRMIASKSCSGVPAPADLKADTRIRPLRPQEPGSQRKEAIAKAPYQRPQHPKLKCPLCDEHPDGFRGEHELRRHEDRVHKQQRRVWICIDPNNATVEGWRPSRPLNICKQCNQQKHYNVYYNAAAHLRRAHFCPRKRGRKARGEERESRAGKAGGDWPPIDWLKANGWLKEVEVNSADAIVPNSDDAAANDTEPLGCDDDEAFADDLAYMTPPYDSTLESLHDGFSAEMLGMAACPIASDFAYGYPTPAMDPRMPWPPNTNNGGGYLAIPQAPPMEHTVSAPPVMNGSMLYSSNFMSLC